MSIGILLLHTLHQFLRHLVGQFPHIRVVDVFPVVLQDRPDDRKELSGTCTLYLAVRNASESDDNSGRSMPAKKKALEVIDNIVNGYYAGWIDDQGRIYGIYGKEVSQ